jgi:multidrug efflux pump subunit AcrB
LAHQIHSLFQKEPGVVDVDDSTIAGAPRQLLLIQRHKALQMGVPVQAIISTLQAGLQGESSIYVHDQSKYAGAVVLRLPQARQGDLDHLLSLSVRNSQRELVTIRQLVTIEDAQREQPIYHKDLLPVTYVVGDMAGKVDSPLYAMFGMRSHLSDIETPNHQPIDEFFIKQPTDPYSRYAVKWDGEWQVTYETFRDMGAAYAVGLVLIYLLVVAQFGSYIVPLIIMAPIPLTIIGVMPGHALLGSPFTATSMIGMIALAGIIVRNSILLVDFIRLQIEQGVELSQAVIASAVTRAQPIVLTGLAAMMGAFFILDDPIFNGLAISLIFGIFVSTVLTLLVIPLAYFMVASRQPHQS